MKRIMEILAFSGVFLGGLLIAQLLLEWDHPIWAWQVLIGAGALLLLMLHVRRRRREAEAAELADMLLSDDPDQFAKAVMRIAADPVWSKNVRRFTGIDGGVEASKEEAGRTLGDILAQAERRVK
jgi:Zn-dependent protease with chaperone function